MTELSFFCNLKMTLFHIPSEKKISLPDMWRIEHSGDDTLKAQKW